MSPIRPILVCMSWRGGARLERCLTSIVSAHAHFDRVVVSVASEPASRDMGIAREFVARIPRLEVISPGRELPTMQHQAFWIDYLVRTGAKPHDWIVWMSYDDEVRPQGIDEIVDESGGWPLREGTGYFGPWAMRHEGTDRLWAGDSSKQLESWTSFPVDGPLVLPAATWVRDQLRQPTYMQMSGSVNPLTSFLYLRDSRPRKRGPMRIEMAIATAPNIRFVQEFPTPISIIYGRSNSDRASYAHSARTEDAHLAAGLLRYGAHHPSAIPILTRAVVDVVGAYARRTHPREEWRVRAMVRP